MSIKLRKLLNLTEQAPQPQVAAPVPAPVAPDGAPDGPEEPTTPDPAASDTAPTPNDPSEYDFTRDFRAFEDAKNKAEAAAKKKLLDKMNQMLLGKKIIANASRGYGQPKTDYTINKVKKVSVEFWYKDWVVIVSDENDKKFFLTTGVNIKIEQSSAEPESPQDAAPSPDEQGQQSPAQPGQEEAPEVPNGEPQQPTAQPPEQSKPTAQVKPAPEAPAEQPAAQPEPQPEPAAQAPAPASPAAPAAPQPIKKKKKLPVAESIISLMEQFTKLSVQQKQSLIESARNNSRVVIEIPAKNLGQFDVRDFMLESQLNRKPEVDVQKIGLNYLFTFQTGL